MTTIQNVKDEYFKVFGTECGDEAATSLLEKFEDGVEHYNNSDFELKNSKYILWGETLEKFIVLQKFNVEREKAEIEYHKKLSAMSREERWLHMEGFDDVNGKWFHEFLLNTQDGKDIINDILGESDKSNLETVKNLLNKSVIAATKTGCFSHINTYLIDEYLIKYPKIVDEWFIGIFGDGGRAWRTAHIMFKSYCHYCVETAKVAT